MTTPTFVLDDNEGQVAWKLNAQTSPTPMAVVDGKARMILDVPDYLKDRKIIAVRNCELWAMSEDGQDGEVFIAGFQESRNLSADEREFVSTAIVDKSAPVLDVIQMFDALTVTDNSKVSHF